MNLSKLDGVKLTRHKRSILELFELYKHLDASSINRLLQEDNNSVSLATIYRVLSNLEKHGIILRHNFNDNQAVYELLDPSDHHDHLICNKCNKVVEFYNCQIEKIQTQIAKEHQFEIINHHLNLYGICAQCKKV